MRKLSEAKLRLLTNADRGDYLDGHCRSQSDHGGLACTLFWANRNGLVRWDDARSRWLLTDDGRAVLKAGRF